VRLLLDTHTFLWFIGGDAALSPYARQLIEDRTNERPLSIASLWDMAIKVSLGRLKEMEPSTAKLAQQYPDIHMRTKIEKSWLLSLFDFINPFPEGEGSRQVLV